MAKLTAVYGPMFAGKTTWIINKINELQKSGEKCLVFKPRLDDRYGKEAKLHAHSGITGGAVLVDENNPSEMLGIWAEQNEQHSVIVIDEVMFFTPDVVDVVREMLARDLQVVVAGLDTNFRKEPFGVMPHLIRIANERELLFSKCYQCGSKASYTARLRGGTNNIEVGADDLYQPACAKCHTICDEVKMDTIAYPDLRPPTSSARLGAKHFRIEVAADSMRVGKTTAVAVIARGLREYGMDTEESYEDWQHNPYLEKSYADPAKNFLESQKWFIKRKLEQIAVGVKSKGVFIQDVAPETDYCYAATNLRLGRMSREHFDEYDKYYRSLDWKKAHKPDLLVYLEVSDSVLIKRANESRREFETVEPDYFLMMKKVNREWLKTLITNPKLPARSVYDTVVAGESNSQMKILHIDTDNFDFANDEKAKKQLAQKVLEALSLE